MSASIILLCEDRRTNTFLRGFLRRRFKNHDIETLPLPTEGSGGSGEQSVRQRFPKELQAIRSREGAVLVVVTDEDSDASSSRRTSLDRECKKVGIAPKRSNDPVIVAVPRRNIESWLWHLKSGDAIDGSKDYKQQLGKLNKSDIRALADVLFRMCQHTQRLLPTAPLSLTEACHEYSNLTHVLR
jgi:hypothetical protein